MSNMPYRLIIAGIAEMGPITLRGREYSGEYLAMQLAINPETPADESARTPQLISEFGRLAAAALADKERAEVDYRVWRETTVHELTIAPDALETAKNMGAVEPDAKKPPSKTAAEGFTRTLPEYRVYQEAIVKATEVWGAVHACYEAAQSRNKTLWAYERSGGTSTRAQAPVTETYQGENHYHGGYDDGPEEPLPDIESAVTTGERTPLPPMPEMAAPPPPPAIRNSEPAPKRAAPPPPPPRR